MSKRGDARDRRRADKLERDLLAAGEEPGFAARAAAVDELGGTLVGVRLRLAPGCGVELVSPNPTPFPSAKCGETVAGKRYLCAECERIES